MWKNWVKGRRGHAAEVSMRVLMVCMGNICRSPMAEAVLRQKLAQAGLGQRVLVDSAGTHGFHRGSPPDPRAVQQAARRGYDLQALRARPLEASDFERFDLLFGMDAQNLAAMRSRCPAPLQHKLSLLLASNQDGTEQEVPDPYYSTVEAFDRVLDLLEPACDDLVRAMALQFQGEKPAQS